MDLYSINMEFGRLSVSGPDRDSEMELQIGEEYTYLSLHKVKELVDALAPLVATAAPAAAEICICAAIQLADGRVIRGHRHDDCIQTAVKWHAEPTGMVQGFMTSLNRFVGRQEAMALQKAASMPSAHGYRGDILFSEDLY